MKPDIIGFNIVFYPFNLGISREEAIALTPWKRRSRLGSEGVMEAY
ncbi:hypothetical protein [Microcoleus sp. F4-D5]